MTNQPPVTPGQAMLLAEHQWEEANKTQILTPQMHVQRTQDKAEFMAQAAIAHDPMRKQLVEALSTCRLALGQLADRPVHYYLELADAALALAEKEGE